MRGRVRGRRLSVRDATPGRAGRLGRPSRRCARRSRLPVARLGRASAGERLDAALPGHRRRGADARADPVVVGPAGWQRVRPARAGSGRDGRRAPRVAPGGRSGWRSPRTTSTSSPPTPRCRPRTPAIARRIEAAGFQPIEEIQPSRHRVTLPLARPDRRTTSSPAISKSTRQRIRKAEDLDIRVVRHDARVGPEGPGDGFATPERTARARPRPLLRPPARDRGAAALHVRPAGGVRRLVDGGARGRPPGLPRGAWASRRRAPRRPDPVSPRRPALDGPLRRPRRGRARPPGRAAPPALAGDPAGDPRRLLGDGPRRRGHRGRPRRADRKATPLYGLYQHKTVVRRTLARADRRTRARLRPAAATGSDGSRTAWRRTDRPMTEPARSPELLAAAERTGSVQLGGLIDAPRRPRAGSVAPGATAGRSDRPASPTSRSVASPTIRGRSAPARCSWRSPGSTSTATTSSRPPRRPEPPRRSSSDPSRTCPSPQLVVGDARPPWPAPPRGGTTTRATTWRSSGSPARTARRRPRSWPWPRSRRPGIATGMTGTAATRIGGVQAANEAHATTPEAPDLQRALRAMRRRRRRGRGHRDDLARPGARPGRRDRLRRRDPDQPDPRASRAPRHVGGVPRRQAAAVREARVGARAPAARAPSRWAGRRPASSTPTTHRRARSSASPRRPARGSSPTAPIPPRTSGRRASRRTSDACGSRTTPRRARPSPSSSWSAGSTSTTRWRSSRSARRSGSIRRPSARAWPRSRSSRAGWSGSTPASRSGSSSTSPTARPRSRPSSTCSLRWRRRAAAG